MAYVRKTIDEYEIQSNNGYGWEHVNTELTWKDAKRSLREYNENEPEIQHKIVIKRVKKGTEDHV